MQLGTLGKFASARTALMGQPPPSPAMMGTYYARMTPSKAQNPPPSCLNPPHSRPFHPHRRPPAKKRMSTLAIRMQCLRLHFSMVFTRTQAPIQRPTQRHQLPSGHPPAKGDASRTHNAAAGRVLAGIIQQHRKKGLEITILDSVNDSFKMDVQQIPLIYTATKPKSRIRPSVRLQPMLPSIV